MHTRLVRSALTTVVVAALTAPLLVGAAPQPVAAAAPGDSSPSAGPSSSHGASDAVVTSSTPGGPRPTSIRLSEDDATTTVLVHGLGDAQTERQRENRRMRHSDLQPTARYVRAGEDLTVAVPEGAPALSLVIGLYGAHSEHNGGGARNRQSAALTPGVNVVTASLDGMVFLRSTVDGGSADVELSGGEPVPSFVLGQTTNDELRAEMARLPDAPFVTVIGERIFGDFQRSRTGAQILAADVPARVAMWDRSVEITNDTYGLHDGATGVARKAPHRIYVASPDNIPGAYATAGDESINFPANGAARDLFVRDETRLWGFWHEIGHTYQAPNYLWAGLSEVTVNISPLHVESAQGWSSTIDSPGHLSTLDRYFARPVEERSYASSGTNEILFDHLRRGFGDEFYPRLNQEMRVIAARGESDSLTDEAKRQLFAVTAARVADRDLREFFRQWGIALSPATSTAMAELPALTAPIWQNRHSRDLIREYTMPAFTYPMGSIDRIDEQVAVGQRQLATAPEATGLANSDGVGSIRVQDHTVRANAAGVGAGTAGVTVANESGIREMFSTPLTVRPGSMFEFIGIASRYIGWMALEPATHELRFSASSGYPSHDSFRGREYVGVTVYDDRGRERSSLSIEGQDTAHSVAKAFDGSRAEDGWYVVVRHREANTRLIWWDDDIQQPRDAATVRLLKVDGTRLVPVTAIPGRGAAATVARGLPGETTDTARVDVRSRQSGVMTVEAPAGTTIADVQVRRTSDDHAWPSIDYAYADDRRRVTITSRTGDGSVAYGPGGDNHVTVSFDVAEDAPADTLLGGGLAEVTAVGGSIALAGAHVSVSTSSVEHGALSPRSAEQVTLARGGTTRVPFEVAVSTAALTRPTGTITLTAPTGSTFAAGQDTIRGAWYRDDLPDGRGMRLTGTRSADGTRYEYSWAPIDDAAPNWSSPRHEVLRWSLDVVTARDADPGASALGYAVTGTSETGAFDARGGTPTIPEGVASLVAGQVDETVTLLRGGSAPVPFVVQTTTALDGLTGRLELIAPAGTVFTDAEEALVTRVRAPGGRWVATPDLVVDDATLGREGRSMTLSVRTTGDLGLEPGSELRWAADVEVTTGAAVGDADLRWVFSGEADGREVAARD